MASSDDADVFGSGPARTCPRCDGLLRPWRLSGDLTVDGCDTCGGVWFDADEFLAAAQPGAATDVGDPSAARLDALEGQFTPGLGAGAGGGRGRCPACGVPLRPVKLKQASDIELDGCPQCRGVWFDEGEVRAAAERVLPNGSVPDAVRHEAVAAALGGAMRRVACPRCQVTNPESAPRCGGCGFQLHRLAPAEGEVLDSFPYRGPGCVAKAFLAVAGVAFLLLMSSTGRRSYEILEPYQGRFVMAIGIAGVLFVLAWLLQPHRIEVRTDGLTVAGLLRRRFIPWESIRTVFACDLGSRAPWAGLASAMRGLRGRGGFGYSSIGHQWVAHDRLQDILDADRMRVQALLVTTRGLFAFGPEVRDHGELLDAIRQRI